MRCVGGCRVWLSCLLLLGIGAGCEDFAPLSGIHGWTLAELQRSPKRHQAVLLMTRGVSLPNSALYIWTAVGHFGPDGKSYLVLTAKPDEMAVFVKELVGKPLDELDSSPDDVAGRIDCETEVAKLGLPWAAVDLEDAKYSRLPNSNGTLIVDLRTNTLYLKK